MVLILACTLPTLLIPPATSLSWVSARAVADIHLFRDTQEPKGRTPFFVGPDVGVYLPTSAKTRDRFGASWFEVGGSIGKVSSYTRGHFDFDLHLLGHGQNADVVLFGLVGVDYRHPLIAVHAASSEDAEKPKPPFLFPYFGASADLMVADLQSVEDNVDVRYRTGIAGSAFLGVNFGARAYFEARYVKTSEIVGFDLSGVQFIVGYRFAF